MLQKINPEGLSIVSASYLDTIGDAERLRHQIDAETFEQLAQITAPGGKNLKQFTEEIMQVGEELGVLEEERRQLEAELKEQVSTRKNTLNARNRWIKITKTIITMTELAELDQQQSEAIFGRLNQAIAKAQAKANNESSKAEN